MPDDVPSKQQDVEENLSERAKATDFPEGTWTGWLDVAGAAAFAFSGFGFVNSFGVFASYYKQNFLSNYSESDIAWIGSLQLFFMFSGGLVSGRIFDSTDSPKVPIAIGTTLVCLSKFMISLSTQYYSIFLSQAVCFGFGVAAGFYPSLSSISHWFYKKRGFALSVAVAGSSLGGVVYPILLNNAFANPKIGFAWGCRIAGFIDIPLLLVTNLTIKKRLGKRPKGPLIDVSFLQDLRFCFYLAGASCQFLGNFVPFYFIQSLAIQKGMSSQQAFYTVTIINASSGIGRLTAGRLSDSLGYFNMAILALLLSSLFVFISLAVVDPAGIYVFIVLFGFTSGCFVALTGACIASICTDLRRLGSMQGLGGVFNAVFGLIGPPIGGAIVARQGGSFQGAFIFSGIAFFCGSLGLLAAKLAFKKPFWTKL